MEGFASTFSELFSSCAVLMLQLPLPSLTPPSFDHDTQFLYASLFLMFAGLWQSKQFIGKNIFLCAMSFSSLTSLPSLPFFPSHVSVLLPKSPTLISSVKNV